MTLSDRPSGTLGPLDVHVALRATSINARDVMIAGGHSPMPALETLIPLSDGAGEVIDVGGDVTRVAIGDRVVVAFNPAHQTGDYQPWMEPSALGAATHGQLRDDAVLNEMAVVPIPDNLSFEQAACLPCAGVVAWNALFESGSFRPGMNVLVTGTGVVSTMALKLAKAAGAYVGVTSSSDEKIDDAKSLGADFGANYKTNPDWFEDVIEHTNGQGADIVLENAGPPSVANSIKAAAQGGRVMQIGWRGADGPPINVLDMMIGGVTLKPVMVGSRTMLERLVNAVYRNAIEFPIHEIFDFPEAPAAFTAAANGAPGKIVIVNSQ